MKHLLRLGFTVSSLLFSLLIIAQPSLQKMQQKLAAEKQNTAQSFYKFEVNTKMPTQAGLLFSPDMAIPTNNIQSWLSDKLALRQGVDAFRVKQEPTSYQGANIIKWQQYFNGIKIEHGIISLVELNSKIQLLQMEFYSIPTNLPTTPVVTESVALQAATSFVGAQQYVWQNNSANNPEYALPHAELVIVEDIFNDIKGQMCLAYKFDIFAAEPASRQFVYVNVLNAKVVFSDVTIKHLHNTDKAQKINNASQKIPFKQLSKHTTLPNQSNTVATKELSKKVSSFSLASGKTKYSDEQFFTTEEVSPTNYRLRGQSADNSTPYKTLNANHKAIPNITPADITDFTDNNNIWDEPSYQADTTNAALDIHWGIEQVIDYWWKVHNRKSYDNNNGEIFSFFHYGVRFGGAFWNGQGKSMFYGDGSQNGQGFNALTSVDVTAHEVGHGICDFTAGLVYRRESGALNEGFSDIWAACVDNYVNITYNNVFKDPFRIADEIVEVPNRDCLRDMTDPKAWGQPDTYKDKDHFWFDVNVENCPVPIHQDSAFGNDFCGVHVNSGVLNKWFHLITEGQQNFINGNGETYTIDPMGFAKTEKIAFYTEMILTPNAGFEAAKIASINAVQILAASPNTLGITLADTVNIIKAWRAVGVYTDSIYNTSNTPIFASNIFTSIATGQRGFIWAGTSNNGLYKYDGKSWRKSPTLTNHNISQILPDRDGGIWIAQFGRTGAQAILGGIGYYQDTSFTYQQFGTAEGLPTRNVRGIFINNDLPVSPAQKFKRVWAACFADLDVGVSRPGSVVFGKEAPVAPIYFSKQKNGVNQQNGFCLGIAGNKYEIWTFASSNSTTGGGQILRYRTVDTAYLGFIDNTNQPVFTAGFNVKALYYDDVKKRWWIGLTTGGIVVLDSATNTWSSINFNTVFPVGTIVNNNAITGDTKGNIYIGTTNGMVFFGSQNSSVVSSPTDVTQYKLYTTADGLPSNNVRGIAIDYRANRLLIATENGIAFRHTLCKECINTGPVFSIMPGNWSNPGIWASGQVPGIGSNVIVKHPVVVTQDANCNSLKVQGNGKVTVNAGTKLNVEAGDYYADFMNN
jgi:Zn-dependent metalloprotease